MAAAPTRRAGFKLPALEVAAPTDFSLTPTGTFVDEKHLIRIRGDGFRDLEHNAPGDSGSYEFIAGAAAPDASGDGEIFVRPPLLRCCCWR